MPLMNRVFQGLLVGRGLSHRVCLEVYFAWLELGFTGRLILGRGALRLRGFLRLGAPHQRRFWRNPFPVGLRPVVAPEEILPEGLL